MTENRCACGNPCRDATFCPACAFKLDEDIAQVADYRGLGWDLDIAISRQDRIVRPGRRAQVDDRDDIRQWPGTLKPTAVPYGEHALKAAKQLHKALAVWADHTATETGIKDWKPKPGGPFPICRRCEHPSCLVGRPPVQPPATITGLAGWLRSRVGWLRHHPHGQRAHDDIRDAVRAARAAVDRPAEKLYAGPCDECGADLYARVGAAYVECAGCDLVYEVEARRQWLLRSAEDVLATATEIARALTRLGQEVTPAAIRGYVHRGRLIPHGTRRVGPREVPVYRLGDVLTILTQNAIHDGSMTT